MRCCHRGLLVAELRRLAAGKPGPSLFRQIAVRLALLTFAFALLNIAIVIVTYGRQPESLAQELLSLEANRIAETGLAAAERQQGPAGAAHWQVRFVGPPPTFPAEPSEAGRHATLIEWTQQERVGAGYRITGVRTINLNGSQRWLLMHFEGDSLRPYVPVILNEVVQHAFLPLVPLAVLMLAFNIFAVRRVLDPLRLAEQQVDGLDPENMAMRLSEPQAPREVNTLVRAVNRALTRLDAAMATLRTFTANAAHELRTPLSIMQLAIDRLPPGRDRDDLARDNLYMSRLVSQMLDLAQADALMIDETQVVDLAEVGRDVVSALAPKAFEQDRELRFEDVGNTAAIGHSEAIFRICRNLIDNALVHAPGDTPVDVTAGPGPQISVRDYGPGIAAADLPHIFERFWRKDRRKSDGAGLGLGIVKRLVEAQGGQIAVEQPLGGGTCIRVTLPSSLGRTTLNAS